VNETQKKRKENSSMNCLYSFSIVFEYDDDENDGVGAPRLTNR